MIKLAYDNATQIGDLARTDGLNLETDEGLETAVTISLFTDARAAESDPVAPGADPRGWWGDQFLDTKNSKIGSRLWLMHRSKVTAQTMAQAQTFAKEALQWLIDDKVAVTVSVVVARLRSNILTMTIDIQRPQKIAPRWRHAWEVQLGI